MAARSGGVRLGEFTDPTFLGNVSARAGMVPTSSPNGLIRMVEGLEGVIEDRGLEVVTRESLLTALRAPIVRALPKDSILPEMSVDETVDQAEPGGFPRLSYPFSRVVAIREAAKVRMITAMDGGSIQDNVFTNIDSAVVAR